MAINERLIHTAAAAADGGGTGNQEEGLILHLDANDVDSYDGDGSVWYDITNHEYTPAINPAEHFNTVTWTGDGATSRDITGVGFDPDFVWIKKRTNDTKSHRLFDSIRGAQYPIYTNGNFIQPSSAASTELKAFITDGFTLGNQSGVNDGSAGDTYVAWCIKAGGVPDSGDKVSIDGTSYATMTAAGLTDGTEALDSLSVNTKLGFSIAKWSGSTALTTDTVAHGLGQPPELIIHKSTSLARDWNVYSTGVGLSKNLHLNLNHAAATNEYWTVNANTFSIHDTSTSGDWVAYSFVSKRGVSKVGSYTGTSSSVEVYTGFQPAFVMIKKTNSSTNGNWGIFDNARISSGDTYGHLYPDENYTENSRDGVIEFTADGFKINNATVGQINGSGDSYIYLAFAAEKPDSLIDDTDLELHLDAGDTDSYDPSSDGSTWSDLTAGNHDVTLTSMNASQHDKEIGGWFEFDGSNDYGTVSHNTNLDLSSSGFTAEAWIYYTDSNLNMILDKGTVSRGYGYNLQINANNLDLRIHATGGTGATIKILGTETLTANKWNHVAFTVSDLSSSATAITYVNGVQDDTDSGNLTSYTNTSDLLIGSSAYNTTDRFDGKIGQVRFYSTALTADEVMQNYRFTKNDYPNGYHLDGTNMDSNDWNSDGYFDFDGSSEYFYKNDYPVDFGTSDYTVIMWFNSDTNNANKALFATYNSNGLMIDLRSDGTIRHYHDGGTTLQYYTSETISTGTWYQIAVTFDRSNDTGSMYLSTKSTFDSTASTGTASSGATNKGNGGTNVGRYNNGFQYDGKIANVRVYDKALSSSEIQAVWNTDKGNIPS